MVLLFSPWIQIQGYNCMQIQPDPDPNPYPCIFPYFIHKQNNHPWSAKTWIRNQIQWILDRKLINTGLSRNYERKLTICRNNRREITQPHLSDITYTVLCSNLCSGNRHSVYIAHTKEKTGPINWILNLISSWKVENKLMKFRIKDI